MEGAIIGPLLTCLVTDQFLRIKKGDSHWYERPVGPQRFTIGKFKKGKKSDDFTFKNFSFCYLQNN